jgi:hypothetical protein
MGNEDCLSLLKEEKKTKTKTQNLKTLHVPSNVREPYANSQVARLQLWKNSSQDRVQPKM